MELEFGPANNEICVARREARHVALARELREKMRSGQLAPGDRLPSFNELRLRWGVGRDTLERMYRQLERDGLISREHRRGVFVAHPSGARRTGTIGFLLSPALQRHPYYVHLLEGVRDAAARNDFEVMLLSRNDAVRWEKVDGVIYQFTTGDQIAQPPGIPVVTLIYGCPGVDSACADDYPGTLLAMEHLLQLGHRRIALLTAERQLHSMSLQRTTAYYHALRTSVGEVPTSWIRGLRDPGVTGRNFEESGYADMQLWLAQGFAATGCTAILAHNDETAIGVVEALQQAGLRVPHDISVIGFDGTEIAQFHRPRLTTIEVPLFEIGARGCELLLAQIQRPLAAGAANRLPTKLLLPTSLRTGQSSAQSSQPQTTEPQGSASKALNNNRE